MTGKEWRARLKAARLCVDCKRQDAYTLNGRPKCAECTARDAERKRKWRGEGTNARTNAERCAAWREKKRAEGICARCGKRKVKPGRQTCGICIVHTGANRRSHYAETGVNWPRGSNGMCWICNKELAEPGYRTCPECHRKHADMMLKNRGKNHESSVRGNA